MKIARIALLTAVILTLAAPKTAAPDNSKPAAAAPAERLRLVFIGALSGYVKPCG